MGWMWSTFVRRAQIDEDEAHGGYWWLAYECSNYFLGCTVCNRTRKKTSFPLLPGATRCTYTTRDTIASEKRVLLDPAEDPVEEWVTIRSGRFDGQADPQSRP